MNDYRAWLLPCRIMVCILLICGWLYQVPDNPRQVWAEGSDGEYHNYNRPLGELLGRAGQYSGRLRIRIEKLKYRLTLLASDQVVKCYPVVFGFNPTDDKLRQGDGCTPEGVFKIRSKYPHAAWTRFIWLDYPNRDSWRKHQLAIRKGIIPANAGIGGEVGIHGIPKGYDFLVERRENWTLGCISMKNKDIMELYPYINDQTVVEIIK